MTFADYDIDTARRMSGQIQTKCPKCSHDRKKKTTKCLSVNIDKGVWNCHHCGWAGSLAKKQYVLPKWENITALSDKVVEWFLTRNISQETLNLMQISEAMEFMPQAEAERKVICFPYIREGQVCNIKYRTSDKMFKMFKGAELIFYNLDAIKGADEVTIVEGEIDCLTLIQLGYKTVLSVPNGATKGINNLQYLDNCYQYFETVKTVVIATDNDEPGHALALELARRIGIEKCMRAIAGTYKDANEMFCKTGKLDFEIKPFPIEGIYTVDNHWQSFLDLLKNGFPKGWKPRGRIGQHISFHPCYITGLTGIPGHGKSEFLDQLVIQLTLDYDLRGAYFSPENRPTEMHILKIIEKLVGKSAWKIEAKMLEKVKAYLDERFFWLYPTDGYTLDNILEKARQAVIKFGINWFVIDPWNKLEHQYTESETKHISESLDKIANFNHKNMTHCFLVAHPTKMKMIDGKYEVPGLYDISGSANFYNKIDIGLTMYKEMEGQNTLHIQKVKFKYWGQGIGEVAMNWDSVNGRYNESGMDPSNWLEKSDPPPFIDFTQAKRDEPDWIK